MDDNSNTIILIIVGVIVLGIITVVFWDKLPDLVGGANKNITDMFQTQ